MVIWWWFEMCEMLLKIFYLEVMDVIILFGNKILFLFIFVDFCGSDYFVWKVFVLKINWL